MVFYYSNTSKIIECNQGELLVTQSMNKGMEAYFSLEGTQEKIGQDETRKTLVGKLNFKSNEETFIGRP